jgi:hypothetical protein
MTQVTQVFAVPVARDDYCERDTLDLALDALQCLDRTCHEIFTRVEAAIDAAAARLTDANQRIDASKFRVNKITGVSSATTIFSKPTYPRGPECLTYSPVLGDLGFTDVAEPFEEDESAPPFEVAAHAGGRRSHVNPPELRELFKTLNPDLSFAELGAKPGLGRLPQRLPSVSSMLLFNSNATPYKQYSTINTLLGEDFASREDNDDKYEMEHAPDTFLNNQDDNGAYFVASVEVSSTATRQRSGPPTLHDRRLVISLHPPSQSVTPSLPPSLTHSLTRSLARSLTHTLTHSLTHSLTSLVLPLTGVQTVDFGFVPAAVNLDQSSLKFMDNLALPGIADNINYQSAPEGLHSFAPSILKHEQVCDRRLEPGWWGVGRLVGLCAAVLLRRLSKQCRRPQMNSDAQTHDAHSWRMGLCARM